MRIGRWLTAALLAAGCGDGDGGSGGARDAGPGSDARVSGDARAADDVGPGVDARVADAGPGADAAGDGGIECLGATPGAVVEADVGGWRVAVDEGTGAWRVTPPGGDAAVLASAAPCGPDGAWRPPVRVAQGEPELTAAFGAFKIGLVTPRSGLEWTAPAPGVPGRSAGEGSVTLRWTLEGGAPVELRFEPFDRGGLWIGLAGVDGADAAELSVACGPDESFFGLGTQVVGLDLRGRRYPLWTQEQGIGKPENGTGFPLANIREAAYAPLGVWHSSAGYAAVIGHDRYSELDLCGADPGRVTLRSLGAAPAFVLVPGETPRARMAGVTALTGRPPPVPDWVFGPWNDAVGGPARLHAVARRLREAGIPSSAIWAEDWIGGEQTATGYRLSYAWEWDRATYPDLPGDIAALHALGFAFLAYFNPFVPEPTRMWDEGVAGGYLVRGADGEVITVTDPAFRTAGLVDLTNPEAVAWLTGYLTRAAGELGVDGWMADFAEWLPVEARMHSGESGWAAHNRYPLDWQRVNRAALEAVHDGADAGDWVYFVRSGWASVNGGTGGIAPVLWGGDQNTDWKRDDGLPTVIPIAVHAGLSGVAVFGSDIAGYTSVVNPPTDKELFFRWTGVGAFHPVMRTHHGSDECSNWSFDRDADTVAHFRRWATVHTLLLPYLRARMAEATATGLPLTRHPYLVEPDRSGLWRAARDQFFLGDELLVAPVVEPGAVAREVHLPGPGWWPLFGGAPVAGVADGPGGTVVATVDAPPTEVPVFVRPGAVLPLLPELVDSFYGASDPAVSDLDAVAGRTRLALYPDAEGAVGPAAVGEATVRGRGWRREPDWAAAQLDGAPLPPCAEVAPDASCAHATGARLVGRDLTLTVGAAELRIQGGPAHTWHVARAGDAWGEWAAPTPLGDLDPAIPPPCETRD